MQQAAGDRAPTDELHRAFDFRDAGVHGADGELGLLFVDYERRAETQRGVAGAQYQQALVERHLHQAVAQVGGAFFGFLIADDFDADHQAFAADFADDFVAGGPIGGEAADEFAHLRGVGDVIPFEQADRRERSGDANGIASEGGSVRTGTPIHYASASDDGAERHAGGDTLRSANNVWLDAGVIASPPLTGASHAGLDFIGDKQDAVLAADALQALQEFGGRGQIAALTLNRLDENSGDFFGIHATAEELAFEIGEAIAGSVFGANSE